MFFDRIASYLQNLDDIILARFGLVRIRYVDRYMTMTDDRIYELTSQLDDARWDIQLANEYADSFESAWNSVDEVSARLDELQAQLEPIHHREPAAEKQAWANHLRTTTAL